MFICSFLCVCLHIENLYVIIHVKFNKSEAYYEKNINVSFFIFTCF